MYYSTMCLRLVYVCTTCVYTQSTSAVVILAYMQYAVHRSAQYHLVYYMSYIQYSYLQCGVVYSSLHLLHHFHYDIQTTCSSLVSSWQCDDVVCTTSLQILQHYYSQSYCRYMYTALRVRVYSVQQCVCSCQCPTPCGYVVGELLTRCIHLEQIPTTPPHVELYYIMQQYSPSPYSAHSVIHVLPLYYWWRCSTTPLWLRQHTHYIWYYILTKL